ncbi:MAG: glycosyltransferase family 9 protein [Flavobacteriales bacterium]|nr:glycosyltransferase family 9 protein [Flavobacteriales bacterium]
MNLLVIRMSAMGDVAMTVPVIKEVLRSNPDINITYVSREGFRVFFDGIKRFKFVSPDLDGDHKGLTGMYKLFQELRQDTIFDAVADLHGVMRSQVLTGLFRMRGIKVASIHKGRTDKGNLVKQSAKNSKQLKLNTERYADVFRKIDIPVKLSHKLPRKKRSKVPRIVQKEAGAKAGPWIGIAPFAQYKGKKYRFDKVGTLIEQLQKTYPKSKIFLFGGGDAEVIKLRGLWEKYPQTVLAAGKMNLAEELNLMTNLDTMISMDSANMHMASLVGTKVVSVWGATHPYAGFMGYGQSLEWAAQLDMDCRPCSVFGNKECHKDGSYACMMDLPESMIVDKVKVLVPVEKKKD